MTYGVGYGIIVGMYVREISRILADGSRASYLQLAQKIRDPRTGIPRDKILHHFGRTDSIDKDQIRRLIASLSRFLDPDERTKVQAQLNGLGPDLVVLRSLPCGGSHVLDQLWRRLGIDATLRRLLEQREFAIDVERLLFALVANRALDPRSKLAVERWVGKHVAIDGLEEVQVHTLYRAMDFLVEHAGAIEEAVFWATANLLNLEVDLLFFDTTTTYFEVEAEDEEGEGLRRYGRPSKDHRPELPQVLIGLAVTRDGIPVRAWSWPGNTADAAVVDEVQRDLATWKLSRLVWVVDRAMGGREQRVMFQRGGGHVIVGEKLRTRDKAVQEALARPGRFQQVRDNLEIKEVSVEEGSLVRRFVVVRNPLQAERDRQVRQEQLQRLEAEIERLNKRPPCRPGGRQEHTRAVCELKVHPTMGRYVRELKSGKLRVDRAAVAAEEKLDGKYLLSTTDPSLTA
ncbi:MAG: IS1634 family transposase, partial [Chloroflexi bacterium]|nr:IS1634 family transposase [Chloroflexota bacterium]